MIGGIGGMPARRLGYLLLAAPLLAVSLSCSSRTLISFPSRHMSAERMMAIGNQFERQGRFAEAQQVYQQILENDPTSPAAERVLAVIAAGEVAHAQTLPIEQMMSVAEFYERHGNVELAQGLYHQILQRQPNFDPAHKRLAAIGLHQTQIAAKSSGGSAKVRETLSASIASASAVPAVVAANGTPSQKRCCDPEKTFPGQARVMGAAAQLEKLSTNQSSQTPYSTTEPSQSNELETIDEFDLGNTASRRIQLAGGEEYADDSQNSEAAIPPAPGPAEAFDAPSATRQMSETQPQSGDRANELWQDKPLHDLKASISLKFPQSESLRVTEKERLSQATPHMAARGAIVHSIGQTRPWMLSSYEWEAPATRHLPLFFEEPNVERLGYTYGLYLKMWGHETGPHAAECLQPIVSGAHFWSRVAMLPYIAGIDPPCEPVYTLGVDRPGSPVPYRSHLIPITLKGALYQAGAMIGIAYIVP